jgi:hypothetical protein
LLQEYLSARHSTTHLEPDLHWNGVHRTPQARKEHANRTAQLLLLLDNKGDRFPVASQAHVDEENRLAEHVLMTLEMQRELSRYSLSWSGKKAAANRLRLTGGRVRRDGVLKVGDVIHVRRTENGRGDFGMKKHLTPNIKGKIIASSNVSLSYQVEPVNGDGPPVWMTLGPGSAILSSSLSDLITKEDPVPQWATIQHWAQEFVNSMEDKWRNTRAMRKDLKGIEVEKKDTMELLTQLDLPNPKSVTSSEYCERIVLHCLDWLFGQHMRSQFDDLPTDRDELTEAKVAGLLAHTVTEYDYELFMGAIWTWHKDRTQNPLPLYPRVLTIITGKEHDCSTCDADAQCQPEHLCCRQYQLRKLEKMQWVKRGPRGWSIVDPGAQEEATGLDDDQDETGSPTKPKGRKATTKGGKKSKGKGGKKSKGNNTKSTPKKAQTKSPKKPSKSKRTPTEVVWTQSDDDHDEDESPPKGKGSKATSGSGKAKSKGSKNKAKGGKAKSKGGKSKRKTRGTKRNRYNAQTLAGALPTLNETSSSQV